MLNIKRQNADRWFNANIGEGYDDHLIVLFLDGVNIACGGHVGNHDTIEKALLLAKQQQLIAGAYISYPDQENFGQLPMIFTDGELKRIIAKQIHEVEIIATKISYPLQYVKPHGALNMEMCEREDIFRDICIAIKKVNPHYFLITPIGPWETRYQEIAIEYGLNLCWEVFADCAYLSNGLLQSQVIYQNTDKILDQLRQITKHGTIRAVDGQILNVRHAQTISFHVENSASMEALKKFHNHAM